jgi:integrase
MCASPSRLAGEGPSRPDPYPLSESRRYNDLLARENALATAILLACPLRIKNLAAIDLDQHIQRPDTERVFLFIEEAETKTGQPIEFELPRDVVEMLDAHLATRAPHMCPLGTRLLFPKRCGTAK